MERVERAAQEQLGLDFWAARERGGASFIGDHFAAAVETKNFGLEAAQHGSNRALYLGTFHRALFSGDAVHGVRPTSELSSLVKPEVLLVGLETAQVQNYANALALMYDEQLVLAVQALRASSEAALLAEAVDLKDAKPEEALSIQLGLGLLTTDQAQWLSSPIQEFAWPDRFHTRKLDRLLKRQLGSRTQPFYMGHLLVEGVDVQQITLGESSSKRVLMQVIEESGLANLKIARDKMALLGQCAEEYREKVLPPPVVSGRARAPRGKFSPQGSWQEYDLALAEALGLKGRWSVRQLEGIVHRAEEYSWESMPGRNIWYAHGVPINVYVAELVVRSEAEILEFNTGIGPGRITGYKHALAEFDLQPEMRVGMIDPIAMGRWAMLRAGFQPGESSILDVPLEQFGSGVPLTASTREYMAQHRRARGSGYSDLPNLRALRAISINDLRSYLVGDSTNDVARMFMAAGFPRDDIQLPEESLRWEPRELTYNWAPPRR